MRPMHSALAFFLCVLANGYALAQADWPAKPVRIIVPFAAGGSSDITARILAEQLGKRFGQSFVVENRAGAGGNVGASEAAHSPPDGYTLLMATTSVLTVNQFIYSSLPYSPERDFAPVSLVVRLPMVIVAHPSLGVKSLQALIDLAKAKPGTINYGTSGAGTILQLAIEMLKDRARIDLVHVPYKGSAPMIQDLIAGHVQVAADMLPTTLAHIRSGRLVAIAVTSSTPLAVLPDVPTAASTLPGFEATAFYGLVAPVGTPAAVINKLSAAIDTTLQAPEIKERFEQLGVEAVGGTPGDLATAIVRESRKWGEIVKAAKIRAD